MPSANRLRLPQIAVIALALPLLSLSQTAAPVKQRIAVYPFEDLTSNVKDMNNTDMKISAKLTDVLITKLAKDGSFIVLDRQKVDEIIKEKKLQYDMNYDSANAPKTGLMGVVDVLVFGQITAFNDKTSDSTRDLLLYKETKKSATVSLAASVRFVSVERGSMVSAQDAHAEQANKDFCTVRTYRKPGSQPVTMGECGEAAPILRGLVDKSVEEAATQLSDKAAEVAKTLPPPAATSPEVASADKTSKPDSPLKPSAASTSGGVKCIGVEDGLAYIAEGSAAGVKSGDTFLIRRPVKTSLTGPDGPIIKHIDICKLKIAEVSEKTASGKCVSVSKTPTAGIPRAEDEAFPISDKPSQVASKAKSSSE